jgi:threonyl-tRNA synthetase
MFLVESRDGDEMGLKAMNCPGHYLLYSTEKHSYREMPIRFHEQTPLHRNEASGVLGGLTRVRQFSQDDGHCFVMESQIASEVEALLRLIQGIYADFGLAYTVKLATRPEKFIGEIPLWDHAEGALKEALEKASQEYTINAGDGAFYGPKIDFDITDAIGRKWQCATIQLDYVAPERFDLTYVGADNAEHRPVVIHRAIFGSFERFIGILIEHTGGELPFWLTPVQVAVLPVADRHNEYAAGLVAELREAGIRARSDERSESVGRKIRDAELARAPYMLVVGDKEVEANSASVRHHGEGDLGAMPIGEITERLRTEAEAQD